MSRQHRRSARVNTARQDHRSIKSRLNLPRLAGADRRALLTGTALASTLLVAVMIAPTPAHAVPINIDNSDDISIVGVGNTYGIFAQTGVSDSPISVVNSGDIDAESTGGDGGGIYTRTYDNNSAISINNTGEITTEGLDFAAGIYAITGVFGPVDNSAIDIVNSSDLTATATNYGAGGIFAVTVGYNGGISIVNSGDIDVVTTNAIPGSLGYYGSFGIYAASGDDSAISIDNSGDISVRTTAYAVGISAETGIFGPGNSSIDIINSGDVNVASTNVYATGILARTRYSDSPISINNSGDLTVSASGLAHGIFSLTAYDGSPISIINTGEITATSTDQEAYGIRAVTEYADSSITITNTGPITVASGDDDAAGIFAVAGDDGSSVTITNSGAITATGADDAFGIDAFTDDGPITVTNSGVIRAEGDDNAAAIYASAQGSDGSVNIVNSGDISAKGGGEGAAGIAAGAEFGSVRIQNSGSVFAEGTADFVTGITTYSGTGTTIINSGTISASSQFAIDVKGPGAATIINSGTITGFVDLTDEDDTFTNQSGGVFEAKMTSLFGGGNDLFRNESGGFVQAATDRNTKETSSFEGLERFENRGTISMVDGAVGDSFTLSNTPGGKDLNFVGGSGSTLAVDVSLGGPGSGTDSFIIEGNVSGTTIVTVNNTNSVGGVFNPEGIKIVTATGKTPNANAFSLDAPIDAGFFDYDLFFTPTGSGFWSLKSVPGAGAQLLPQLVTAAQDIWHQGSSTWFDRTADLRVLVNGGGANAAYSQDGAAQNDGIAPAVWVRGSGGWLDRDSSGSTSANGRNYKFDLDRQLDTMDFQMGLDLGSRDLLSQGDALVFGLLGGFIHGDLDYDNINRNFDYDGGQVGVYATYMKGGLFVDTLLNVHLYELDANGALGFPNNDLDATTVGLRSDAGYRFGSFSGGAFLEPLATLEVTWADIDGFALGGNRVSFDDEANVRGRLGLRAGTTMEAWDGTMMEPFVTGSLWGNLSGDNQATLASNGSTFRYTDDIDDVWGELSAGVNFFNFSQTTSLFAKVDVTFGDDVSGVGGKAGIRVAW